MRDFEKRICETLEKGGIIIYPTDTVYGLGCSIKLEEAVKKVYAIKNPDKEASGYKHRPFLVGFSHFGQLLEYVSLDRKQLAFIIERCKEGTSFVVKKKESMPDYVTGNKESVGIRMLLDKDISRIVQRVGPIVTTSANISGKKPPVSFDEIEDEILNKADESIKGQCYFKRESVIWDLMSEPYKIIRSYENHRGY